MVLQYLLNLIYKALNIPHTHALIHAQAGTNQFSKTTSWTQGTSKHVSQVKTRYRKFCPNTVLSLLNDSRELEVNLFPFHTECIGKNFHGESFLILIKLK